ncbi:hypothetical protein [Pseudocnuella soli]|uniref:hypothetical protein n=1 Tax=Pseudocnuella soli TaxID=2502779 RepID=UPI00105298A6|nr:hypothetical protein [Pseudocnuella soli]
MGSRPFFRCLQITAGIFWALVIAKSIAGFVIPVGITLAFMGLMLLFMTLSHFRERKLAAYYPSLFMAALVAAVFAWIHLGQAQ